MPHQDLVILFPIWACMALVTLVLTQASLDLDTLFHTWASLSPGTSRPILGLKLNWLLWLHLWTSHLRGDTGHPLGFTWASESGPYLVLTRNC